MSDDSPPDGDASDGGAPGVTFRDRDRLVRTPAHGVALDCLGRGTSRRARRRPRRRRPAESRRSCGGGRPGTTYIHGGPARASAT
ncbi:hypothetical protein, partial [Halorubrum sp. Ea1]|uniref:hypothetical protein n=1 Tax=Halorubrum sp. Ea1 TaxID=1480718 RepID=UPI001C3D5ED6